MSSIATPIESEEATREAVLSPVDRVSEVLFGLFMALSFIGAVSVADSGRAQVRELFITALGCNLAWGLVDAIMYVVRTVTERGKSLTLARSVREAPDAQTGRGFLQQALSKVGAGLVSPVELEAIRGRIVALPSVPARPTLQGKDLLAALGIFLLVVAATFPVVLPFLFMSDVEAAKNASYAISLVLLFLAGLALGRYAGYGTWKAGFIMVGVGTALVIAINLLGG
jgi:VIT1/CCC1 family predicted Fe2+/Mn2+ transporter